MTDPTPHDPGADGNVPYFAPSRREMLRYLAYGSAGVALAGGLASCTSDTSGHTASSPSTSTTTAPFRSSAAKKTLVVIELGGGNDGLSTLVPYESSVYQKARPTLALGADDIIDWGDGLGLNKRLADLNTAGLAIVGGIGTTTPDLSHFEMLDRWWEGSIGIRTAAEQAASAPGFLGRVSDQIQGDERFTAISLKFGSAAGIRATKASTTGLPPVQGSFLETDQVNGKAFGRYLKSASKSNEADAMASARMGIHNMLSIIDVLNGLPAAPAGYPDTDFGTQLAIASRLVRSPAGVRIIHIPMGISEYDTHAQHATAHAKLMTNLNDGLAAFSADLHKHGLGDKVLIATTSEFGRRVEEHSEGLDHGAASLMMLLGPVKAGLHGEPSSVDKLDELGDLIATMTFDRYLATMAAFLDVDPAVVLKPGLNGKPPAPIDGLLSS